MTTLSETAVRSSEQHAMFSPGAPVVVMVSGGADSVALLHLLASGVLGDHPLRVLHVNHLLRDQESDADAHFVAALAERLGVSQRTLRFDVAAFAKHEALNLEDAGRRVRYRFAEEELDAWCLEHGADPARGRIAVAHTLDDRVETFFMRALAGSGTGGLGSIQATRGRVVRPLIEVERAAVRAWLVELGEVWREDASNTDTARARAHVRAELLPALDRVAPGFRPRLARTMDLLQADDALLGAMSDAFARDFADVVAGTEVVFRRDWMLTLDRAMARRTVRSALLAAFPDASRLEAEHVEALVEGLGHDRFARDLPGGLRALTEYDRLVVRRASEPTCSIEPTRLAVPGVTDLGPAGFVEVAEAERGDLSGMPDSVVIDLGKVNEGLVADRWRPGDRMNPLGMQGSRKVSDLLTDAKVPRRFREVIPVVRDGEHIVWVAGQRMSEDFRVTPGTASAVRLTWRRPSGGA